MLDEEIYLLTKHGNFSAEYVEKIPIYKRRHFLHLLQKEFERMEEEYDKMNQQTKRP